MRPIVAITAEVPDVAIELLSRECEVIVHPAQGVRSETELLSIVSEADGMITMLSDPITRNVLAGNDNLRCVSNFAVGTNNIDLEAARELGVAITNTPGVLTAATADLTFALILAVTRNVIEGDRMLRAGEFSGWHPLMLLGSSLDGKTLGILGMGRIGLAVARRALAFGMKVIYASRSAKPEADAMGALRVSVDELIRTADILTLHAPLTDETRQLLNGQRIASMKRGAYLINTARGPLVDEAAVAEALRSGHLSGAGFDVYEREPAVNEQLLHAPNTVLLPHLGSATVETRTEMASMVANDMLAVLNNREPKYRVT